MKIWGLALIVLLCASIGFGRQSAPSPTPSAPATQSSGQNPSPGTPQSSPQSGSQPAASPSQASGAIAAADTGTKDDTKNQDKDKPATPSPDLTPDANGKLSQAQMHKLVQVVVDNYRANEKKWRNYTYTERFVENKLDKTGAVKSKESRTSEIMELYDEQVERLVQKDDKPLSAKDANKEDEKIQKFIDKRKNETEEERTERLKRQEKERENLREIIKEVADAYDFQLVGSETLNGRDNWVLRGERRPEFRPGVKDAELLTKFHGRLWIDKDEMQLTKMDAEALDTVSFGWILARFHKGTRLVFEQQRVNNDVWLPEHISFKFEARVALLKGYNEQDEWSYSDYKKFQTSTRIVGVSELKQ